MIAAGRRSKISRHGFGDLLFGNSSGAESLDEDAHRMRDADCISNLHLATIGESRRNDVLGDPARRIGGGTVDLRRILTRKRAAAMARHSAVGVGDDLAAGKPGVALWTADDETARRVDEDARALVVHRRRNNVVDHSLR